MTDGCDLLEFKSVFYSHLIVSSTLICKIYTKSIYFYRYIYKRDVHESVHRDIITKISNKMQLCRLIYYSLSALHVSSEVFAHHNEEHLTVFTASASSSNASMTPAGSDIAKYYQML